MAALEAAGGAQGRAKHDVFVDFRPRLEMRAEFWGRFPGVFVMMWHEVCDVSTPTFAST